MFTSAGAIEQFDYSVGVSRLDTDNDRPNNQYRLSNAIANVGWSPNEQLRIGSLFTYSLADAGSPNTITDPRPFDNLETERWMIAPHLNYKPVEWWEHKLIVSYDEERQINDPNFDGFLPGTTFVGPTRALFERFTVDYQNDLKAASWLTLTSGFFYSQVDAGQERPFVSQAFGPMPTFISDYTEETAVFLQASMTPCPGLNLVAGGRYDHFNEFGDVWTYRFAGSYLIPNTATRLHASVATGFSPPSSQDKIFRFNPNPGQPLDRWSRSKILAGMLGSSNASGKAACSIGATYFHNDLSNVIGFNGMFETLNLGSAITQGVETEIKVMPIPELTFTLAYTYLDTEKTSALDINQPEGARLPRRPRNELYLSASYLWCRRFRTTIEAKFVNAREELNFGGPNFDIEDYTVVNLIGEYEVNKQLSIFGRIENLGDEQYAGGVWVPGPGAGGLWGIQSKVLIDRCEVDHADPPTLHCCSLNRRQPRRGIAECTLSNPLPAGRLPPACAAEFGRLAEQLFRFRDSGERESGFGEKKQGIYVVVTGGICLLQSSDIILPRAPLDLAERVTFSCHSFSALGAATVRRVPTSALLSGDHGAVMLVVMGKEQGARLLKQPVSFAETFGSRPGSAAPYPKRHVFQLSGKFTSRSLPHELRMPAFAGAWLGSARSAA